MKNVQKDTVKIVTMKVGVLRLNNFFKNVNILACCVTATMLSREDVDVNWCVKCSSIILIGWSMIGTNNANYTTAE